MGGTKRERETEDDYYNEGRRFQNEACQKMKVRVSFDTTTHFILIKKWSKRKIQWWCFFFASFFYYLMREKRKERRERTF